MTETAHPLVGRDRELGALDQLLQEVGAGAPRFLVLSGRTRDRQDFVDCRAGPARQGGRPFDRLAADELGELASVFPALRSLRPATPPATGAVERFRAHYAARELIERLAARTPLVLTLDDIQWSDGASIELIGHLLRHPPDAAVMLVASVRTGQAPAMLTAAIENAARSGRITALELGPLNRADAARLVGATVAPTAVDGLYRDSGGNPFYLLQLARDTVQDRVTGAPGWTDVHDVPAAVRESIARELDGLAAPARAFAQAAAVAGDPFDLDLAVPAAGDARRSNCYWGGGRKPRRV